MTKRPIVILFAALFTYAIHAAQPKASDPFLGQWVLDLHKSKIPAATMPKSMVIRMEPAPDGQIHYHSETVDQRGQTRTSDYIAGYDGKLAAVTGDRGLMFPVALTRIDANTVKAIYRRAFVLAAISTRKVSPDGKHMTITTETKDRQGGPSTFSVDVFDKVK